MPENKIFLDSNILVYSISVDEPDKRRIARKLLKEPHSISLQIIFEYTSVAIRKLGYSKTEAIKNAKSHLNSSDLYIEDAETAELAFEILNKQSIQVFDSKIVASALLSGCSILYSEDFQHGQVFEKKLKVINPFLLTKNK